MPSGAICPDGSWIPTDTYGRCLKVFFFQEDSKYREKASWVDGMQMCAENGAVLATLHNQYEDRIAHMLTDSLPNSCWIGLRRYILKRPQRGWIWVDQDTSLKEDNFMAWGDESKSLWHVVPPEEKCGEISSNGWGELPCWGVSSKLRCIVCSTLPTGEEGVPSTSLVSMSGAKNLWQAPPINQPLVAPAPIQMPDRINKNWQNVIAKSDGTAISNGLGALVPPGPVNVSDSNLYYMAPNQPESFLGKEPSVAVIPRPESSVVMTTDSYDNQNNQKNQNIAVQEAFAPINIQEENNHKNVDIDSLTIRSNEPLLAYTSDKSIANNSSENNANNSDIIVLEDDVEEKTTESGSESFEEPVRNHSIPSQNVIEPPPPPHFLDSPVSASASTVTPTPVIPVDANHEEDKLSYPNSLTKTDLSEKEKIEEPVDKMLPDHGNDLTSGENRGEFRIFMASLPYSSSNDTIDGVESYMVGAADKIYVASASDPIPWKWTRAAPYETDYIETYDSLSQGAAANSTTTAEIIGQSLPTSSRATALSVKDEKSEILNEITGKSTLTIIDVESNNNTVDPKSPSLGGLVVGGATPLAGAVVEDETGSSSSSSSLRNNETLFRKWSSNVIILTVLAVALGLTLCCCGITGIIAYGARNKKAHEEAFLCAEPAAKPTGSIEDEKPEICPNSSDGICTLDDGGSPYSGGYTEECDSNNTRTALNKYEGMSVVELLSTATGMGVSMSGINDTAKVTLSFVSRTPKIFGNNNTEQVSLSHGEINHGEFELTSDKYCCSEGNKYGKQSIIPFSPLPSSPLAPPTFRPLLKQEVGTCPKSPSTSNNKRMSDQELYNFRSVEPAQFINVESIELRQASATTRNIKNTNMQTLNTAA